MRDLIIPMFGSGMCEEECHMGTSLRREPKLLAAKLANSFLPAKIRKVIWAESATEPSGSQPLAYWV